MFAKYSSYILFLWKERVSILELADNLRLVDNGHALRHWVATIRDSNLIREGTGVFVPKHPWVWRVFVHRGSLVEILTYREGPVCVRRLWPLLLRAGERALLISKGQDLLRVDHVLPFLLRRSDLVVRHCLVQGPSCPDGTDLHGLIGKEWRHLSWNNPLSDPSRCCIFTVEPVHRGCVLQILNASHLGQELNHALPGVVCFFEDCEALLQITIFPTSRVFDPCLVSLVEMIARCQVVYWLSRTILVIVKVQPSACCVKHLFVAFHVKRLFGSVARLGTVIFLLNEDEGINLVFVYSIFHRFAKVLRLLFEFSLFLLIDIGNDRLT